MCNEKPDISSVDLFNAVVTLITTAAAIYASVWLANWTFLQQEASTYSLESKLRYSEIATDLHRKVRTCKENFSTVSLKVRAEGFKNFISIANEQVFSCRSELLPFISGLKIFKAGEPGFNERVYLLGIDKRLVQVKEYIASLVRKNEPLTLDEYKKITDLMTVIAIAKENNFESLEGLENLLIAN